MKIHCTPEVRLSARIILVFAGSCGLLADSAWAAPKAIARVLGRVVVKRKNLATTTTLQANDKLYPGDIVVTGVAAGATIEFNDGSRVDMNGRSTLEITSPIAVGKGKTLFRALNGSMAAHLRPGKVVATRTALVRVKGTVILITVAEDGTSTLTVLEGSAEFFNPCGSVLVPAGSQSVARPGNAPSEPSVVPDVQALLREWQDQTDVLRPFVTPVNLPMDNSIQNGFGGFVRPALQQPPVLPGVPPYLSYAVAQLDAVPLSERSVYVSAVAKLYEKSRTSAANSDCGCGTEPPQ